MEGWQRQGKIGLTLLLTVVFVTVSLLPNFARPAHAAPSDPLPVAEDPLGQQPEQRTPEVSVDVDVRDGHLTARVVDNWGSGRRLFLYRSYTNTSPDVRAAAGYWHLNQILE